MRRHYLLGLAVSVAATLAAFGDYANAQDAPLIPTTLADLPAWAQERRPPARKALVIGISNYRTVASLKTPAVDRGLVAQALGELRFDVTLGTSDPDRDQLFDDIDNFVETLQPGDVALVYYSGHGIARNGGNYLVPAEAGPPPDGLEYRTLLELNYIVDALNDADVGLGVIVLDACRTDPFVSNVGELEFAAETVEAETGAAVSEAAPAMARSSSSLEADMPAPGGETARAAPQAGLAKVTPLPGVLVAFAAEAGRPAYSLRQGESPTLGSLYARSFIKSLGRPGRVVFETLNETGREVQRLTRYRQTPFIYTSPHATFMLRPTETYREEEAQAWIDLVALTDADRLAAALRDYVEWEAVSEFADAARRRLFELEQGGAIAVAAKPSEASLDPTQLSDFLAISGALLSPSTEQPASNIAVATTDLPVFASARAGLFGRRSIIGRLSLGAEVRLLAAPVGGTGAAAVALPDGRLGFIDAVTASAPTFVEAAAIDFAEIRQQTLDRLALETAVPAIGPAPSEPTQVLETDERVAAAIARADADAIANLVLAEADMGVLEDPKVWIQVDVAPDALDQTGRGRQLSYRRALAIRRELVDRGASARTIVINALASDIAPGTAVVRLGH